MLAKAVRERIRPEASMAPDVVVACPTPKPPEMLPVEVAPMNAEPPTERSWEGDVVPTPRRPKGDGEVEIERTGMLEVEVAMEKALMARLGIVEVEEVLYNPSALRRVSRCLSRIMSQRKEKNLR
ncbi:MAG: hypothetical protein UW57_C0002G0109 [Candidatus Giovannonibacteria bacterium GW2011_GWA1_44_29]|uniref:Uncharacterized protein n=1 Tax=Candidatus Giovannonibacteria bacterium GW2011_GWA1_44_29 TaxID=1618646 RepID=A0A0G1LWY2_9BACT|nr:MAG: hypothetical protein UW57_C0002G0109 [Candidatus Giovannonibacteria bacterium GW2011_GWA1_44_29]